jgi:hypothetical protein
MVDESKMYCFHRPFRFIENKNHWLECRTTTIT